MLTVEYLEEQITRLEADEAQLLAHANMARGAIQMCHKLLDIMKDPQEAMPLSELEQRLGVKMDEPQTINSAAD